MAGGNPTIDPILQVATPEGTPAPANARGAQYSTSVGSALENLGGDIGQLSDTENKIEVQKQQAEQDIWLSQARSAGELTAQSLSEESQRTAKLGQPILPQVKEQWDKHVNEELSKIDNPILKARYANALEGVSSGLEKSTQAFDYQQQDAYTIHNVRSTNGNKTALYAKMTDRDAITTKALQDIGEQTSNIDRLPLAPDKRLELSDETRKGLVLAALDAKTAIDPVASLNENAPARSPMARLNDPSEPRGIRNNNPGNLMGDQGFQGYTKTDAGQYAQFDTPENGLRAMAINLRNQQDIHGLTTVQDIFTKYAPPDKNNTAAYIKNVASALNVEPGDKIDMHNPDVLAKVMQATIKQENGVNPYSAKNITYAVTQALDPENAGESPGMLRPDGGARTGDPLFALLKPEEQQQQIQHMEAIYRQQQYFQRQASTLASAQLTSFEESLKQGYPIDPQQMEDLKSNISEATPAVQVRAARLITRNESLRDFTPMAPDQLQNYLQTSLKPIIDSGKATPAEVERYDVGNQLLKTMSEQVKTDPLAVYSRGTGTVIPPIQTANSDDFARRNTYANSTQQLYGSTYKAFQPAEVPRMADSFTQATPQGKRAFLINFAKGFGDRTPEAAAQIWGKDAPEIAYAASMLATPNLTDQQAQVPMGIVAGAIRIQNDKEKSIPIDKVDAQMIARGYDTVLPPGSPAYDRARAATRALFASRFNGNYGGQTDQIDTALKDIIGPIVTANGVKTIPPYGIADDAFQRFVENMTPEQFNAGLQNAALAGDKEGPAQVAMPQNDDGDFKPGRDKVRLSPVANGIYQLRDRNGKPYLNPDKSFTILRFSPQDIR